MKNSDLNEAQDMMKILYHGEEYLVVQEPEAAGRCFRFRNAVPGIVSAGIIRMKQSEESGTDLLGIACWKIEEAERKVLETREALLSYIRSHEPFDLDFSSGIMFMGQ